MKEFLKKYTKNLNIDLDDKKLQKFEDFYNFLQETNAHTNLIAKASPQDIWLKHFVDSLYFSKIKPKSPFNLLDIGSGGGFPSLPIQILYEESKVMAVDSIGKKINFLNTSAKNLNLSNFNAVQIRAEDLSKEYLSSFDYVTARAVSSLDTLSEYCIPYLKQGGLFVAYKSKTAKEEIEQAKNAIKILGGKIVDIVEYNLEEFERNLIIIEKTTKTPPQYPRKAGLPKKSPLR